VNFAQIKEHERATAEVRSFMHRRKITTADLIEVGGEDLSSPNFSKVERARHVEQCWQMMARLAVSFLDLNGEQDAA
jgi:hypothetical protein